MVVAGIYVYGVIGLILIVVLGILFFMAIRGRRRLDRKFLKSFFRKK